MPRKLWKSPKKRASGLAHGVGAGRIGDSGGMLVTVGREGGAPWPYPSPFSERRDHKPDGGERSFDLSLCGALPAVQPDGSSFDEAFRSCVCPTAAEFSPCRSASRSTIVPNTSMA